MVVEVRHEPPYYCPNYHSLELHNLTRQRPFCDNRIFKVMKLKAHVTPGNYACCKLHANSGNYIRVTSASKVYMGKYKDLGQCLRVPARQPIIAFFVAALD